MKARDRGAVSVLRATLAAIDNAEAVDPAEDVRAGAVEQSAVGLGAAEAERRLLTERDIERIVRAECADLESAAHTYATAGRLDRADELRTATAVLTGLLGPRDDVVDAG